jgi:hypothetical protein
MTPGAFIGLQPVAKLLVQAKVKEGKASNRLADKGWQ